MRIAYLVAVLLLIGCTKKNDEFCRGAPENHCDNVDGQRCDGNEDCTTAAAPVCKIEGGEEPICVQCVARTDCKDADTPVCGAGNKCTGCRSDDDCESKACLETGACADKGRVIYTRADGVTMPGCGIEAGVNECSLAQAMMEIQAPRNIVRLERGAYMVTDELRIDEPMTLIARLATIKRTNPGPIVRVENSQAFKLVGGTLQEADNDAGIRCDRGLSVEVYEAVIENMELSGILTDSCPLTVSRSIIKGNDRGGITMVNDPKRVAITNNFIVGNGEGTTSPVGGMLLKLTSDSVVEYNTIVDNSSDRNDGSAGGVKCENGIYNAPNNIVYRNPGGLGGLAETAGTCTFNDSFVRHPDIIDENVVGFADPNGTNPDYHLTAGSPATVLNARECLAPVTKLDFDGDRRPLGDRCDLGADEVTP